MQQEPPGTLTCSRGLQYLDKVMTPLEKLKDRLWGDPENKTHHFHVWWGPDAAKLTPDERAQVILDAMDSAVPFEFNDSDRKQIDVKDPSFLLDISKTA